MTRTATAGGRDLMIVPGILFDREEALPDVIRGEETQVIGALRSLGSLGSRRECRCRANATGDVCFVLPGTHSKWVLVKDGRIVQFATYMTGELFATLRQHSILGRLMPAADSAGAQDEANQGGGGSGLSAVRSISRAAAAPAT